jgi:hypothetical protein
VVTKVKVSTVVANQLPAHFASSESELSQLLKVYYQWLELSGNPLDNANSIYENFYLESADTGFLKFFTQRIIPNIPQDALINKKLIAKHARNFYQSKGSEDSFKFLFQAIYGKPVDIYYPKNDLFRTSSASWIGVHTIKVYTPDPNIKNIVGRKLIGQTSTASGIVETVTQNPDHYVITLSKPLGVFGIDEVVSTEAVTGQPTVYCRTLGLINVVRISNGGSGYTVGTILTTSGGDGQDFVAQITQVGIAGDIQQIGIVSPGSGYTTIPPIFLGAGAGIGASVQFYIGAMLSVNQFKDDTDFLSSTKKLQDGSYYQEFSYVLKAALSSTIYGLVVDALLHPAGMRRFSQQDTSNTDVISDVQKLLFPFADINDLKLIDLDIFNRFHELIVQIEHNPAQRSLDVGELVTNLLRQTRPESLTPVVKYVNGALFYDIVSFVIAYGKTDIIEPFAGRSIADYANMMIRDIAYRLSKTFVELTLDETLTIAPSIVGIPFLDIITEYIFYPTVGSFTGDPLISILRQLKPDSMTPISRDFIKVRTEHVNLVSAIGSIDIMQPFYNATINDYATIQIQNMFTRSIAYTSLTTGVYP